MPGTLKRQYPSDEFSGVAPSSPSEDQSAPRKRHAMNGVNGEPQVNGAPRSGGSGGVGNCDTNGILPDIPTADASTSAALDAIVHDAPDLPSVGGYLPMALIIERLAQEVFNNLDDMITANAELQQGQQVNGASAVQSAQAAVEKKERIWDFAQASRAKLIKLLVLSDWSRRAQDVRKVIDINFFFTTQKASFKDVVSWMGELKRIMNQWRVPPPDVGTALQTLSSGRAAWIPDHGYLPKPALSPRELLKALRAINSLLTIRLNLHDTVPLEMANFKVASGRATFTVHEEFELDLSLADVDPKSQLYFIDFRFAFSPCGPRIPEGQLRNYIEGRVNDILRREGLAECYDFLHGLVLTHKLSIFRDQAYQLSRNKWVGNVRIEPVHRSLIVQYWPQRPGAKSWIEIGIRKRPKRKDTAPYADLETPMLFLRWHRHGKEVIDHDVQLDLVDLSLESLLKEVIAKHNNFTFKEAKRKLKGTVFYGQDLLSVKHRAHPWDPSACALSIQVNRLDTVTVTQEAISGAFALMPPSKLNSYIEAQLNRLRDPPANATSVLVELKAYALGDAIELLTKSMGWHHVRTLNPKREVIGRHFGSEHLRPRFFRPLGWTLSWLLAFTTGPAGDKWWAVETKPAPANPTREQVMSGALQPIAQAFELTRANDRPTVFEASFSALANVQRIGAGAISSFLDTRELTKRKLDFRQRDPERSIGNFTIPDVLVQLGRDPGAAGGAAQSSTARWCSELVKASFVGFHRSGRLTRILACARLRKPLPNVQAVTETAEEALCFHPSNGTFVVRFATAIGESTMPGLLKRFARVRTLLSFLDTAKKFHLACSKVSLTSLTFTYPSIRTDPTVDPTSEAFQATIDFPHHGEKRISFDPASPHTVVANHLNAELNKRDGNGFDSVASAVLISLPLLVSFTALRDSYRPATGVQFRLRPRSATTFVVRYGYGMYSVLYEISLRQRRQRWVWYIVPASDPTLKKSAETIKAEANPSAAQPPAGGAKTNGVELNLKPPPENEKTEDPAPPREVSPTQARAFKETFGRLSAESSPGWVCLRYAFLVDMDRAPDWVRRFDAVFQDLFTGRADASVESGASTAGTLQLAAPVRQAPLAPMDQPPQRNAAAPGAKSGQGAPKRPPPSQVVELD